MTKYKLKLNHNYLLERINKDRTVKLIYDFTKDILNESLPFREDSEYALIVQCKLAKKMYGPEWTKYIDLETAYMNNFKFNDQYYSVAQMMFLLSEVQYRFTQKQCSITMDNIKNYNIKFDGNMSDNKYIVMEANESVSLNDVSIVTILNSLIYRGVLDKWEY